LKTIIKNYACGRNAAGVLLYSEKSFLLEFGKNLLKCGSFFLNQAKTSERIRIVRKN